MGMSINLVSYKTREKLISVAKIYKKHNFFLAFYFKN